MFLRYIHVVLICNHSLLPIVFHCDYLFIYLFKWTERQCWVEGIWDISCLNFLILQETQRSKVTSLSSHSFVRAELRSKPGLPLLWPVEALFYSSSYLIINSLTKVEKLILYFWRIYPFRHVSGWEVAIWSGVCARPFSPCTLIFSLARAVRLSEVWHMALSTCFAPHWGAILEKEARKEQGLCGLEGTGLGRDGLGVEPQPGTEPGEGQAGRNKKQKGPK